MAQKVDRRTLRTAAPWSQKWDGENTVNAALEYLEKWKKLGDAMPSLCGLAMHLKITRETVYAWQSDEDPTKREFTEVCMMILTEQQRTLENKGLTGDFNPTITKAILTKHGYKDRTEHSVDPVSPLRPVLNVFTNGQKSDNTDDDGS